MNSRRFVVACLVAVASLGFYPVQAADRVPEVRVMSYNIRYGTARRRQSLGTAKGFSR